MPSEKQLALDVRHHRAALGREDFLVTAANAEAVEWLDRWPNWPGPALVVYGPAGSGKTHLAHVFAQTTGAPVLDAAALPEVEPLGLLAKHPALALDDADAAGDDEALLHIINAARETGHHLLLTASAPPARWAVRLPDLRSRLLAAPVAELHQPDDALMAALLVKLFTDRQLKVGEGVIAYLCRRMERSFAAARRLVAAVDARALASRRDVTVPLVREVLADEDAT